MDGSNTKWNISVDQVMVKATITCMLPWSFWLFVLAIGLWPNLWTVNITQCNDLWMTKLSFSLARSMQYFLLIIVSPWRLYCWKKKQKTRNNAVFSAVFSIRNFCIILEYLNYRSGKYVSLSFSHLKFNKEEIERELGGGGML